ncbi:MAG: phosphopyruvate hydratase [Lachnospiraceae bacterium]
MNRIINVKGREILNAKGRPTVEAEVMTENGISAVASVPSGTSRGKYEAFELYDGGTRYGGFGTRAASSNISKEICEVLLGMDVTDQEAIDRTLCELDGTPNKSRLGGNAILSVSVAAAKAGAASKSMAPYEYLRQPGVALKIPDIVATVIAGGVFSTSGMEFEDYMMILHGFEEFPDELEALCSLRWRLEEELRKKYGNFMEDGGALAVPCQSTAEAFEWILRTASLMGYESKVSLGLDVAASELWEPEQAKYRLMGRGLYTSRELAEYYKELCGKYPLTFIEDGFEQDDFEGFSLLKNMLSGVQIVGDDLFATNIERLKLGIKMDCANGLLLKINQIGTVTEAIHAGRLAREHGMDIIVSLRSGETTDDFIADLSVAIGARQIKLGSPVRAERNVKYNRLLKIWKELQQ